MQGWKTAESHMTVGIVYVLGHALNNPHLWPSAHAACAAGLAFLGHSFIKHRTMAKRDEVAAPSFLAWLWGRIFRRTAAKPPAGQKVDHA